MLTFYENAFSPFARKVRMVLEHKGIEYEAIDGLSLGNRDQLLGVNGRVEVPTIVHDGIVVVNSADIVAYLERVFPERPVFPADHAGWVKARAWERCADSTIDPILIDISYWTWAIRNDQRPEGLLAAARADMDTIYAALEAALEGDFVCGEVSVADMALFPHLSATKLLGVPMDGTRFPKLLAWYKRCRDDALFAGDLSRTKTYLSDPSALDVEREKIFWRGDRIEWVLARGHHEWFMREIEEDRVLWPGLGIPS